jgi:hypothetical protein
MRPALDSAGHRVPRTKPTCLLHTWRPHRRRPYALVLHLYHHQSSRNLHLQYLAKSQSTQRCQSLITPGSDHSPLLEPHMVLNGEGCPWFIWFCFLQREPPHSEGPSQLLQARNAQTSQLRWAGDFCPSNRAVTTFIWYLGMGHDAT